MAKQMMFSQEARQSILEGLSKLANAVRVTMGPTGRNVILQKSFGSPRVSKDGVTVSKEVELPQPFENMGAKLINQVACSSEIIRRNTPQMTSDQPKAVPSMAYPIPKKAKLSSTCQRMNVLSRNRSTGSRAKSGAQRML